MPNSFKYSTDAQTLALKKGNFYIGTGDVDKGPTSSTGYYNGITPPAGGYTIYLNKASNGPSIYVPSNDSQLISLTNGIAGANYTTANECFNYFAGQSDKMVVNIDYERTITGDLSVCLDAGYVPSYPRSGSTYYNIGNNNNPLTFSLLNGVIYSTDGGGSLLFDGVDDEVVSNDRYTMVSGMTWDIWVKRTSDGNIFNMMMSNFLPYMAFRGTGSGSDINKCHVTYRTVTGGTTTQRNLYTTGSTFSNNVWYNFTYTLLYDLQNQLTTAKIYVNGVFNTSSSNYSDSIYQPSVGSRLRLGNYTSNQYPFPGYIGRFLVYNRVLTDAEVLQNYNAQKSRYIPTPTPTPIPPTPTPIPPTPTPTSSTDSDAQAFITAAGITDPTQQSAINTLVVGLKTDGLWSSMMAIYPFVGGTASSHKYNLKDPRDLNAAYRLTFYGGWGHGSYGIAGNSTNTYADTNIVNYNLGQMGAYATAGDYSIYGGRYALDYQYDVTYFFPNISYYGESSFQAAYFSNSTDGSNIMFTFNGYIGLSTISGGDGTSKQYFNGSLIADINPVTANPSSLPVSLWFGAIQTGYNLINPTYDFYSDGTFAFGFVTSSIFNSTQNTNLYNRIQTYQTTLGRDV